MGGGTLGDSDMPLAEKGPQHFAPGKQEGERMTTWKPATELPQLDEQVDNHTSDYVLCRSSRTADPWLGWYDFMEKCWCGYAFPPDRWTPIPTDSEPESTASGQPATDADIAEYKRLADAATAGPWEMIRANGRAGVWCNGAKLATVEAPDCSPVFERMGREHNCNFIAASRTAVPELIARLRDSQLENLAWATRAENDALRLSKAAARIQALETALDGAANYLAMLVDDHREIRFARAEEAKARAVLKGKE